MVEENNQKDQEKNIKKKKTEKIKLKQILTVGKRKSAIARASIKQGTGKIKINGKLLDLYEPEFIRMFISEPIILAGDVSKQVDISVNVRGGGIFGQAEAARQAIAKGLVELDSSLKQKFLEYDRTLLVADSRRNEPHKPSRSKQGPRRHKQRSKR
ncbi:MAG: 30S ribosomal protein S9 [Candidatus Aenigmatarchaeota archaeon]|nr:30S ribosomal protein S9 [Candidatus Aenigmarchaeota archaeon]